MKYRFLIAMTTLVLSCCSTLPPQTTLSTNSSEIIATCNAGFSEEVSLDMAVAVKDFGAVVSTAKNQKLYGLILSQVNFENRYANEIYKVYVDCVKFLIESKSKTKLSVLEAFQATSYKAALAGIRIEEQIDRNPEFITSLSSSTDSEDIVVASNLMSTILSNQNIHSNLNFGERLVLISKLKGTKKYDEIQFLTDPSSPNSRPVIDKYSLDLILQWNNIRESSQKQLHRVTALLILLEQYQGDILLSDQKMFSELLKISKERQENYAILSTIEEPKTEEEFEAIGQIGENFKILIRALETIQAKIINEIFPNDPKIQYRLN